MRLMFDHRILKGMALFTWNSNDGFRPAMAGVLLEVGGLLDDHVFYASDGRCAAIYGVSETKITGLDKCNPGDKVWIPVPHFQKLGARDDNLIEITISQSKTRFAFRMMDKKGNALPFQQVITTIERYDNSYPNILRVVPNYSTASFRPATDICLNPDLMVGFSKFAKTVGIASGIVTLTGGFIEAVEGVGSQEPFIVNMEAVNFLGLIMPCRRYNQSGVEIPEFIRNRLTKTRAAVVARTCKPT